MPPVPPARIRTLNDRPVRPDGAYVLYWMTASRRLGWNFALDRAVEVARSLRRPLVILEALRCDYPWASARHHRFVLDGMADHDRALRKRAGIRYFPYVEPAAGAGKGLLQALAAEACQVVADDWPAAFFPRMLAAAAARVSVRLEAVDANGLLPVRASGRPFQRAHDLRRFLQRELIHHLEHPPAAAPVAGLRLPRAPALPPSVEARWPRASASLLAHGAPLPGLPIDPAVAPTGLRGGPEAGARQLERFLADRLPAYATRRNHPDDDAGSGLSPYLHHGQVGTHQVLDALAEAEGWSPARLEPGGRGQREGWWGMSPAAEAFLDQLVTWRELGFNRCVHEPGPPDFDRLPAWAQRTLAEHAGDPRPHLYTLEQLEAARTHDPVWNAAQTQLVREGTIHTYLRMVWGKKVLEWSPTPEAALEALFALNDRYAFDGRDPNSASGILWCLGRYDRAWGPERPVFGKVRFMSSEAARRKLRLKGYLERFGAPLAEPDADRPG